MRRPAEEAPYSKMSRVSWVLACAVLATVVADSIPHPESRLPLAAASELSSRLAAHAQHVQAIQDPRQALQDPRLPIPTPQDIEAIKKIAQILITLGQQVIPAIVGDPAPPMANCDPPEDAVEA